MYKVKDYYYVGGSYGKTNEREMMLEIMNNGPIVCNIETTNDFRFYRSGVYHALDEVALSKLGLDKTGWEILTHAVTCIGWGEENGVKYWLV